MEITATMSGASTLSASLNERETFRASVGGERYSVGSAKTVLTEVTLLASAWEGDTSPYSQVVTIEGVTANSKVDLQPSVEQLTIFHQKDIAFVTENEDGVVTVFAIGDKPANDYTIQATITEVA